MAKFLFLHFFLPIFHVSQLKKGRLRGRIDVGLSVMAMKKKSLCIDLDTEDSIYHLKVFVTHRHTKHAHLCPITHIGLTHMHVFISCICYDIRR